MATCPTCRTQYSNDASTCPTDGAALLADEAFLSADRPLEAGEMVGEYKVESKIGEGGFGAVYRAVHPLIGKVAAVKVLGRQFSSNPQMVSRFIAEARAVNQIRHRNIIDIFAFGTLADGRQYFVMELLDGTPFDSYVQQHGKLPLDEAIPILRAVARAVDAAHQNGIAHRDLKPENVFVCFDEDGRVTPKLLDFGIAKLLSDPSGGHKTKTGTPMGTPYYMSPEQCYGKDVDHRTDIYALGVMTYQVVTGRLPFNGETTMEILVKHMSATPDAPSSVESSLSPAVDAPILAMMAKDPSQRPLTLLAGIDALALAVGQPVPATQRGAPRSVGSGGVASALPSVTGPAVSGAPLSVTPMFADPNADPGAQTFLATSLTPDALPPVPAKSRAPKIAFGLVGLLVLGIGAGVVALKVRGATDAPTGVGLVVSQTIPPTTATPTPSATATATPQKTASAITFTGAPPKAQVYRGSESLGLAASGVKLPFGPAEIELVIKAPGYKPWSTKLLPDHDALLEVTMEKVTAAVVNTATPTTKINKDLEDFPH